jgi:nucleoside-diphosphate-sugar epimerase
VKRIFISGGTGYMGRRLVAELLDRGHEVQVLAREGSEGKVPVGGRVACGDALDASSFQQRIGAGNTVVHLVGVAHPAPWNERAFRSIDLASNRRGLITARFWVRCV